MPGEAGRPGKTEAAIPTVRDPPATTSVRPPGPRGFGRFWTVPFWLLLAAFLLEFLLFDRVGARQHTPVFPRWNDQIQYLGEAYTGYEFSRQHGFMRGLWQTIVNRSAQGTLHDFWVQFLFALSSPSRSAALALNLLALIAWQAALFLSFRRLSGSSALALAVAMLPLALRGPWENVPGSSYDFRLDHLAMCMLGISSAAALGADGFRSRGGSLLVGVAVGLTLLTRFLAGTYFVVLFAGAVAWIARGPQRTARLTNLGLAALVACAIAAPVMWLNREWIWNYYFIGHFVGPESAIRDPHLGVGGSLVFVGAALGVWHLGAFFIAWAAVGAGLFALARGERRTGGLLSAWIPGALFLLAPAVVLILHKQKSEVVVSAVVPGVVVLTGAAWAACARRPRPRFTTGIAAVLALGALAFFTQRQLRPAYHSAMLADAREVNSLADHVFAQARAARLDGARVAADYITDTLDGQVLRVICYERNGVWMPFEMTLPISIAEPTEAEVMQRLRESDFVFLAADEVPPGPYPYDRKLAELRPKLRTWC